MKASGFTSRPARTRSAATISPPSEIFSRSYINFYLANGGVVMPGFGIEADSRTRDVVTRRPGLYARILEGVEQPETSDSRAAG